MEAGVILALNSDPTKWIFKQLQINLLPIKIKSDGKTTTLKKDILAKYSQLKDCTSPTFDDIEMVPFNRDEGEINEGSHNNLFTANDGDIINDGSLIKYGVGDAIFLLASNSRGIIEVWNI